MRPTFQTKRLLVYKIPVEHGPDSTFDLYLGYQRDESDHPYRHIVDCAKASGENCVLWTETHERPREGFALELLNGIVVHERFKEPLYPNYTIREAGNALFNRHDEWFKRERAAGR